jgi:serralysin
MATLTVTTTHDFSGDLINDITDIVFNTSAFAMATFSAVNFPIKISNTVNVSGDGNQNAILVNLTVPGSTFSAAGWNVSSWNGGDFIEIDGSSGADTITGPSAAGGFVYLRGGAGADIIYGGSAQNDFIFRAGDIKAGDQVFGGAANDSIRPVMDGTTYDFRLVGISSVNRLDLNSGIASTASKVILGGDQIGAGGTITTIFGANNNFWDSNLIVQGQTVDLSTVSFFEWTEGEDTVRVAGTKGADSLTGSFQTETLFGGRGHDLFASNDGNDIFDFNSIFDSLRGAKRDVISDFSVGDNAAGGLDDDLIDLKTIDANSLKGGNQAFHLIAGTKFHHKAGELMVKYNSINDITLIQGDVDGNGKADFQIELTGQKGLSALDFIL